MASLADILSSSDGAVLAGCAGLLALVLVSLWLRRIVRGIWRRVPTAAAGDPVVLFREHPAGGEAIALDEAAPVAIAASAHVVPAPALAPAVDGHGAAPAVASAPTVAGPVRRRPKPAWEVEAAGLTAQGLLDKAHGLLAAGQAEAAAQQLRACARAAAREKEPGIEAMARLELGDIARAAGDLTTACEHWQIARSLFTDLRQGAEAKGAEVRMERAGCPTDWVLTKF